MTFSKLSYKQSARVTLHSCAETNDTALFAELLYRRDRDVDLNFTDEVSAELQLKIGITVEVIGQ